MSLRLRDSFAIDQAFVLLEREKSLNFFITSAVPWNIMMTLHVYTPTHVQRWELYYCPQSACVFLFLMFIRARYCTRSFVLFLSLPLSSVAFARSKSRDLARVKKEGKKSKDRSWTEAFEGFAEMHPLSILTGDECLEISI